MELYTFLEKLYQKKLKMSLIAFTTKDPELLNNDTLNSLHERLRMHCSQDLMGLKLLAERKRLFGFDKGSYFGDIQVVYISGKNSVNGVNILVSIESPDR